MSRVRSFGVDSNIDLVADQGPEEEVPLEGVRLSVLQKILDEAKRAADAPALTKIWRSISGQDQAKETPVLTTTFVCQEIVKPATAASLVSYSQMLIQKGQGNLVGKANVFVSHVWGYLFEDVVRLLEEFVKKQTPEVQESLFFWVDIVVVNQHQSHHTSQEWWSTAFKDSIEKIGHTLVLLDNFRTPRYVTRSWCLWELYCSVGAISSQAPDASKPSKKPFKLEIMLPKSQRDVFVKALLKDIEVIKQALCEIDVSKATAFKEDDRQMILAAVESSQGGCDGVTRIVTDFLRAWFADAASEALDSAQDVLTEDHGKLLNAVANMQHQLGKFQLAESLHRRAITIKERVLGPDHAETARSYNNLAGTLHAQNRLDEAAPLYRQALAIRESKLGLNHVDTAGTCNNLALLFQDMRNFVAAEQMFRRSLEINENVLGPEDRIVADLCNNIGSLLTLMGRLPEAEASHRRALSIYTKVLGADHPSTANSANNVAAILHMMGKPNEAEPLYRRALAINERVLGSDHPNVGECCFNIGLALRDTGKLPDALPFAERAVNIRLRAFGPQHPDTQKSVLLLHVVRGALGIQQNPQGPQGRGVQSMQGIQGLQQLQGLQGMQGLQALQRLQGMQSGHNGGHVTVQCTIS